MDCNVQGEKIMSSSYDALAASDQAFKEIQTALNQQKSFKLIAGAGAGKTFTLIRVLKYLIGSKSKKLIRNSQRIACITFTEAARDELLSRIDRHPLVEIQTIHSFCWSLLKNFQKQMASTLFEIESPRKYLSEKGITKEQLQQLTITYSTGKHSINIEKKVFYLNHNDIPRLMAAFLHNPKFQNIFSSQYPILFIDEYQDTELSFFEALLKNMVEEEKTNFLIGLFGDPWQKIYREDFEEETISSLREINLGSNFRSSTQIVTFLNKMRESPEQHPTQNAPKGNVYIFHTNSLDHNGKRLFKEDLDDEEKNKQFSKVKKHLTAKGWDFGTKKTKTLMLTHKAIADRLEYKELLTIFSSKKEQILKNENPYMAFFHEKLIPAIECYQHQEYGQALLRLSRDTSIRSQKEKQDWASFFEKVKKTAQEKNVSDVLDLIHQSKLFDLPSDVVKLENHISDDSNLSEPSSLVKQIGIARKLRSIPFKEIKNAFSFKENNTPFSTNHSVKGLEFPNVLVILSKGWNNYNWDKFLKMAAGKISIEEKFYNRNRNLFYVVCSRPQTNLALFFTQKLSQDSLDILSEWNSKKNIFDVSEL